MEALGRLFNIVPTADAVEVNLEDASGVTFVCVGADTYTLREAQDNAATGVQDFLGWDRWYTNTSAVGGAAWVLATDDSPAAALVVASGVVVVHVDAKSLSDGFTHVQCNSTAAGLVYAITHDLNVQRDPANLPIVSS